MKRRLEMLLGALLASALLIGGCVAQAGETDDDDDDVSEGQVHAALVADAVVSGTHATTSTDQGSSSSLVLSAPHVLSDPQPQPWVPPAPADTSTGTPGAPQQH